MNKQGTITVRHGATASGGKVLELSPNFEQLRLGITTGIRSLSSAPEVISGRCALQ